MPKMVTFHLMLPASSQLSAAIKRSSTICHFLVKSFTLVSFKYTVGEQLTYQYN